MHEFVGSKSGVSAPSRCSAPRRDLILPGMKIRAALTVPLLAAPMLAACTSSGDAGDYKTMTCAQWLDVANSDDPIGKGLLTTADNYLDSTRIDPVHGARDAANLADVISGSCGPRRLAGVKIVALKRQVVRVFLSVYPEDRA